jgi:signal peptidase
MVALISPLSQWAGVDAHVATYVLQPATAVLAALMCRWMLHGQRDRLRHKSEKSLIIGSVLAVWFVAYFSTGMIVTYTHNAVAASVQAIVVNLVTFGIVAWCMEYMRHGIMLGAGRRHVVWFGIVVSVVFAIEQMSVMQLLDAHNIVDGIKLTVSTILPALAHSLVLTYLAFNAGFGPQLTYRLGILAVLYVPPIIPKYDWYIIGISWLVLAIATYVTLDRTRKDMPISGRHYHHAHRASNIIFVLVMVVTSLFMVGAFSYQPQVIMSNSMVPVFSRGAMVIVEKVDAMDVQVGDIIQYRGSDRMITHRVIGIDAADDGSGERVFTTQGDNNPSPDPLVKPSQVIGIIRAEVPYIGYPTVWLKEIAK